MTISHILVRSAASSLAAVLLLVGCGSAGGTGVPTTGPETGTEVVTSNATGPKMGATADPGPGTEQPRSPSEGPSSPPGDQQQPTTATPTDSGPPSATTEDLGGVGANGRAYLRPDHPRMIVEIDVQEGASAGQDAVDHLLATIRTYADKPGGVQVSGGNQFRSDRREWTRDALRAAAEANRSHYSDGQTAVLYLLYVRGGFYQDGEQTQAIGVTYNASEIALFPDRWSGVGTLVGADRSIERAVLVHEFGHVLGLVNITYQSELDHEDPDHPGHSDNRRSVMYYAVETTLVGQVFEGPPPDEFDDADRADIEGLRNGRY